MNRVKEIRTQNPEQRDVPTFEQSSFWHDKNSETSFLFVNYDHHLSHTHKDFCEILCVINGEVINSVNRETVTMKGGDCCLILRDDIHALYLKEDKKKEFLGINFVVRYDYFLKLKNLFGKDNVKIFETEKMKLFHLNEEGKNSLLNKTYLLQTPNREYDREKEFNCRCVIIDLLKRYVTSQLNFEEKEDVPEWLNVLIGEMRKKENLSKSLDDFILSVPYSYPYVAREFKKHVGCSMVNYLTTVKLHHAENLLLNTSKKMLEISMELGYSSLSHFNHIFKKMYGLSPSKFRNAKGVVIFEKFAIKQENEEK